MRLQFRHPRRREDEGCACSSDTPGKHTQKTPPLPSRCIRDSALLAHTSHPPHLLQLLRMEGLRLAHGAREQLRIRNCLLVAAPECRPVLTYGGGGTGV